MKLTQIRNATVIVDMGGTRFLVDPMLSPKGAFPGFEGTPNSHIANPTVELPMAMDAILDVDAVIVTHIHPDHWDDAAAQLVPKAIPIFAQHDRDGDALRAAGFTNVRILVDGDAFNGVTLRKTSGQHGTDEALGAIGELLGEVSGIVFQHPDEKALYIAGDTVWNRHVADSLAAHRPDIVVLNAGDAQVTGLGSIIMDKDDVLAVYEAAPDAIVVASHMEAVNHAVLTRAELRAFAATHGMNDRLLIPEDGETLAF